MRTATLGLTGLIIALALPITANAYHGANRWGGTTTHSSGSTSMSNAWGGSMTHTRGEGTTASGAFGGSATHEEGSGQTDFSKDGYNATHTYGEGTSATNPYGGSAYHAEGSGYTSYTGANGNTAYHSPYYAQPYPGYHPPTTVNYYGSGCYNCMSEGAAALTGAAVGLAAGAAVAGSEEAAANANTANAYNAGYTAGTANEAAATTASTSFVMGNVYAQLPANCITPAVAGGATYFLCGNTWFQPASGANGVYYRVVPAP
jgi:hypothetical protein